ncbi:hypothetical protein [Zoogloea sp.]|uniref:hypothetical protein n=1 Tax=Zoogloea sp. TaxID=49181 RepID=UPI002625CDFC|nr:hypothetical protein [Zoogloea sp.]MDD3353262.1 hypothetical protein [Zoogloea sp.]
MNAPTHTLRVVFALSMLACSVILMLFIRGRAEGSQTFWLQLMGTSAVLSTALCLIAFRKGRMRLEAVPLWPFLRLFVRQLAIVYAASAFSITGLSLAIIYAITRSGFNALALAVLAGVWLSLWLAPGVAAFTTWRVLSTGTLKRTR